MGQTITTNPTIQTSIERQQQWSAEYHRVRTPASVQPQTSAKIRKNGMSKKVENLVSSATPSASAENQKLRRVHSLRYCTKKYVANSIPNSAGTSVVTNRACAMIVGEKENSNSAIIAA